MKKKVVEFAAQAAGRRRTTLAAKAVILDESGRVLVLRRSATDPRRPLTWDLVGGIVEYGEDPVQALAREVFEETGLSLSLRPVATSFKFGKDSKQHGRNRRVYVVRLAFAGRVPDDSPVTLSWEHDKYMWASADDVELPEHWRQAVIAARSEVASAGDA